MSSIQKPDSHLTAVKWRFPSVHPEGRKFALISAFLTLVAFWALPDLFGWLMVGLTIWVLAFFRDPVRTTPVDPTLVIAPADGLVTMITRVPAPPELAGAISGEFTRVSIFMSVFDVHINRSPIAGTIRRIAYIPGKFLNADLDKASEDNERQHFLVERDDGVSIASAAASTYSCLLARVVRCYWASAPSPGRPSSPSSASIRSGPAQANERTR
jgi:phosphatidylserine decarboxylase